MITFTVPGSPIGKGRPRLGRVGPHARMFTPEKTVNYETLIGYAGQQAMAGRAPLEGALSVELDICCQIPASWSQKKQRQAAAGEIWPTTKPDKDNVIKAIYDGLNGIAWRDDVQVCVGMQRKRYGLTPCVVVVIRPLDVLAPATRQPDLLEALA